MKKIFLALTLILLSPFAAQMAHATVSSTTSKVIYTGDGSSSSFSFTFNIYKTTDLVVQKILISTGVATTLTLNTDYTVSMTKAAPSPGSITLTAGALASTYQLVILRTLPLTQLINISDPYYTTPAATWNEAHDRATMLSQQLQEQVSRSILGPTSSSTTLTLPSAVAGQCLGWDGASGLTNLTCSGSSGGGGGSAFNPPIADSQLQAITTASKVNGSAIYSLSSVPSGAGLIPVANLPVGTTASKVVQLTAAAKYPAVDGSLITSISGANFTALSSTPSGAGVLPIANIATGTPTGSKFVRDDGTLQLPNNTSYATGSYQIFGPSPIVAITGGTYSKFFEMYVPRSGTINVNFSIAEIGDSGHLFGRIYRNGVAVGTERTSSGGTTNSFAEDISGWTAGDLLQLYCKTSGAGASTSQIAGAVILKESTPIKEASTSTYINPTVYSGVGVPPTDLGAQGNIYLRTDGAAATTLYVKTGASTWTAK